MNPVMASESRPVLTGVRTWLCLKINHRSQMPIPPALVPAVQSLRPRREELLVERGVEVDHVTVYRWVQRAVPVLA
jgi:hypothetical protein